MIKDLISIGEHLFSDEISNKKRKYLILQFLNIIENDAEYKRIYFTSSEKKGLERLKKLINFLAILSEEDVDINIKEKDAFGNGAIRVELYISMNKSKAIPYDQWCDDVKKILDNANLKEGYIFEDLKINDDEIIKYFEIHEQTKNIKNASYRYKMYDRYTTSSGKPIKKYIATLCNFGFTKKCGLKSVLNTMEVLTYTYFGYLLYKIGNKEEKNKLESVYNDFHEYFAYNEWAG